MYLTTVRIGVQSAESGDWGEVDKFTGINVLAATQVIITLTFLGVMGLQVGQYWAEVEDKRVYEQAMEEEPQENEEAERKEDGEIVNVDSQDFQSEAKASGSETSSTTATQK